MELYDLLRQKTGDIQRSLDQLNHERVPALGKKLKAYKKQLEDVQTQITKKTARVKELETQLDTIAQRLRELEEEKDHLEAERPQIVDELTAVEEELERRRSDKERLTEQIADLKALLREAVEERKALREELRQREREAFQAYLSGTRSRLKKLAAVGKDLAEKRAMRRKLEEERHRDPAVMSLWERRVELRKLLGETRIEANRKILEGLLREVEQEIEKRFPGSLEVESLGPDSISQETLYAVHDSKSNTITVILPINKNDWFLLNEDHTEPYLVLLLRIGWSLAKTIAVAPPDCLLKVGSVGWVIAAFNNPETNIIGGAISVPLEEGESLTLRIKSLPPQLEDLLRHEGV